jgi:hypothetical protein
MIMNLGSPSFYAKVFVGLAKISLAALLILLILRFLIEFVIIFLLLEILDIEKKKRRLYLATVFTIEFFFLGIILRVLTMFPLGLPLYLILYFVLIFLIVKGEIKNTAKAILFTIIYFLLKHLLPPGWIF